MVPRISSTCGTGPCGPGVWPSPATREQGQERQGGALGLWCKCEAGAALPAGAPIQTPIACASCTPVANPSPNLNHNGPTGQQQARPGLVEAQLHRQLAGGVLEAVPLVNHDMPPLVPGAGKGRGDGQVAWLWGVVDASTTPVEFGVGSGGKEGGECKQGRRAAPCSGGPVLARGDAMKCITTQGPPKHMRPAVMLTALGVATSSNPQTAAAHVSPPAQPRPVVLAHQEVVRGEQDVEARGGLAGPAGNLQHGRVGGGSGANIYLITVSQHNYCAFIITAAVMQHAVVGREGSKYSRLQMQPSQWRPALCLVPSMAWEQEERSRVA